MCRITIDLAKIYLKKTTIKKNTGLPKGKRIQLFSMKKYRFIMSL
jgi:hypothetical protein